MTKEEQLNSLATDIATLKAYYEVIKSELGKNDEYRTKVTTHEQQLSTLEGQVKLLFKTRGAFQKCQASQIAIRADIKKLQHKYKTQQDQFSVYKETMRKKLKNYEDIEEIYLDFKKQMRKAIIALVVSGLIILIGAAIGGVALAKYIPIP